MKRPSVSTIIPVYNEERTILKFQESLRPIKGKTEILFVDGGSTDRTRELISPEFSVISSGKGRAVQMNQGAFMARGEILPDCKLGVFQ